MLNYTAAMASLRGKTVILGVTGGIAAYKCPDLVRLLIERGTDVHVVMTKSALNFVTPLTLRTLSGNPVYYEMFEPISPSPLPLSPQGRGGNVEHISLAEKADAILVAPATADIIAKVAHGICDELLTTIICATKSPVIFSPSMNVNMWDNRIVQENITRLKNFGYKIIEPEEGRLACGDEGKGRLPRLETIISEIEKIVV